MSGDIGPHAQRVLLLGGSSEIGLAIIRALAREHRVTPMLLGRDQAAMEAGLAALRSAGCEPGASAPLDADELSQHERVIDEAFAAGGPFDLVILAVGVLGGQDGLDSPREEALEVMRVDFLGSGSLLLAAMNALRRTGGGKLVVLSSVAAERPRASNAIYGAAKAGLDALSQGLADAAPSNLQVLVVRPGFVHTKMTAGLEKVPFATTPEVVAQVTLRGLAAGAHTVWAPPILRLVFAILRHLPRSLYRRLPI